MRQRASVALRAWRAHADASASQESGELVRQWRREGYACRTLTETKSSRWSQRSAGRGNRSPKFP
jgi:hypothetical protein